MELIRIWESVCKYYELDPKCPKVKRNRGMKYLFPRQIYHHFAASLQDYSLSEIGSITGHLHCNILNSRKAINNYLATDNYKAEKINSVIDFIIEELGENNESAKALAKRLIKMAQSKGEKLPNKLARKMIEEKILKYQTAARYL